MAKESTDAKQNEGAGGLVSPLVMCSCPLCMKTNEPTITMDGKHKIICPKCKGFRVFFDPHAGAVSCHNRNCGFTTYGGEHDSDECLVSIDT